MSLHPPCWITGDSDGLLYHLEIISEVEMNDGHFYTRCGQYLRVVHCELGVPDVKKCGVCFRSLDVASLESASSAGDTTELLTEVTAVGHERVDGLEKGSQASCGADAAPGSSAEVSEFAPQGASQGVSSSTEGRADEHKSDGQGAGEGRANRVNDSAVPVRLPDFHCGESQGLLSIAKLMPGA